MSGFVPAPIPGNETQRIAAVRALDILDTAEEDIFNAITRAAAEACGTSMASITFIDVHRQWFKAKLGIAECETARDISFCAHAINGNGLFVVEDAAGDDRFRANPLVTGKPHLRSYAGMPLINEAGLALGTLCVLDTVPRLFDQSKREALRMLAESAMRVLQLRRRGGMAVFARAVDITSDGVTICGMTKEGMRILYANESFLELTGYSYLEAVGQACSFPAESGTPAVQAACCEAIEQGQMTTVETKFTKKDGSSRWAQLMFVPHFDERCRLCYIVAVYRDITAEKEAETQAQQLYGMRTTLATLSHVVNNFLNSAQLYSASVVSSGSAVDARVQKAFDAALESTRSRLAALNRMEAFKDRPTPFGFAMLDVHDE